MRSSEVADELYNDTMTMMQQNNLRTNRPQGRNKKRKMDDHFVFTTTTGRRDEISDGNAMRTKLYYPTLDRMISEMKSRFSPQCDDVMLGIDACNPSSESFLDIDQLRKLSSHYNMELFDPEVTVAKNFIKAMQLNDEKKFSMEKVYGLLDSIAFPTLKKVIQVALTVPVTSCKCERCFSCLRRVKTWLRANTTQDRLDYLGVLSIERSTYTACTDQELVKAFNDLKTRRA